VKLAKLVHRFRSAITGRYVTKAEADKHPKTTVRETRKKNRIW